MRFYRQTTSGDLKAIYKHAKKTCNIEMKGAMNDALDHSVTAAQAVAPVYDPARWSMWWGYEHHYTPPGTLKASIRHTKAVAHARGVSYSAQFRADAKFASYIEEGFRHKKARKFVVGKHFMESTCDLVFWPTYHMKLREAVERMFMTKAV